MQKSKASALGRRLAVCVSGANNGSPVSAMVSEEAQQLLHDATELDYLTHIIIRMYENKR